MYHDDKLTVDEESSFFNLTDLVQVTSLFSYVPMHECTIQCLQEQILYTYIIWSFTIMTDLLYKDLLSTLYSNLPFYTEC